MQVRVCGSTCWRTGSHITYPLRTEDARCIDSSLLLSCVNTEGKLANAEGPREFLAREEWLSSQREAGFLPLGDDSCFERNVRYSPGGEFLVVWRGVPTATHCQALCKIASPECSFFTFMKNPLFPLWLQVSFLVNLPLLLTLCSGL